DRVEAIPFRLDGEVGFVEAMRSVDTFYNTFWRRFPLPDVGFDDIVEQSASLIDAARAAGVRRIVHFSVSNASDTAPTNYFRAKARVERLVSESGLSHAIIRPTLLYG